MVVEPYNIIYQEIKILDPSFLHIVELKKIKLKTN